MKLADLRETLDFARLACGFTFRVLKQQGKLAASSPDEALVMKGLDRIAAILEAWDRVRPVVRQFSSIGNPDDYAKRPRRLDVPFEWCEDAYLAVKKSKVKPR